MFFVWNIKTKSGKQNVLYQVSLHLQCYCRSIAQSGKGRNKNLKLIMP